MEMRRLGRVRVPFNRTNAMHLEQWVRLVTGRAGKEHMAAISRLQEEFHQCGNCVRVAAELAGRGAEMLASCRIPQSGGYETAEGAVMHDKACMKLKRQVSTIERTLAAHARFIRVLHQPESISCQPSRAYTVLM